MRLRRRLKKTTRQYITVAIISFLVLSAGFVSLLVLTSGNLKEKYEVIISNWKKDMDVHKRQVYTATMDLHAGDVLTDTCVVYETVYSAQPQETYMKMNELGGVLLIDVPAGTQVMSSMLTTNHVASDVREVRYNVIYISDNILTNDVVDIRIMYPNGESYVIVSKKEIRDYETGMDNCSLWLTQEEQLQMAAAIVDAGLYTNSQIYVTKYVKPSIQTASKVTYIPNIEVISLLETDPNIVERYSLELNKKVRKALENRLAEQAGMNVNEIKWDIKSNYQYMEEAPIEVYFNMEEQTEKSISKDTKTNQLDEEKNEETIMDQSNEESNKVRTKEGDKNEIQESLPEREEENRNKQTKDLDLGRCSKKTGLSKEYNT